MKLYTSRRAPNPRRVAWIMAEKGITDIELEEVNLLAGEHRTPAYLGKAGWANSPALELDDGTVITESLAIGRYLESVHPEPNLFGRDPVETAVIEMWTRRAELTTALPLMQMVRQTHPAMAVMTGTQDAALAASSREQGERGLALLDQRLAGSPFLAGGRLTVADIVAYTGLDFGRLIQYRPPEGLEHVGRWASELKARPASSAGL